MMIGKSLLFAVVLVVLHVGAEKVCSYVPQNDCLDEWDCPSYYYMGQIQTIDDYVYAKFGGVEWQLIDEDCTNLPACPLIPTAEDEGIICEADAIAFAEELEKGYYEDVNAAELAALDVETMPEGTANDLDNCVVFDVYEVVCTGEDSSVEAEEKVCSYVPQNDCLDEWDCQALYLEGQLQTEDEEVYHKFGGGVDLIDGDCANLPACPLTPSAEDEGIICEADAVGFMGQLETYSQYIGYYEHASDAELAAMDVDTMPEGTANDLDNCKTIYDVYEVVCTGGATTTTELETTSTPTTTTELETTTLAPTELCATYTTAASCPASYCVIKNDRNGAFKKCKRIGCKTFDALEADCDFSAECQPKYKKDGSFKKCLLKKNLV